jgi:GNAT superfamily N-acetyltransferase
LSSTKTIWKKDEFYISTNKEYIDTEMIVHFLKHDSYWANERSKEAIIKSISHTALCYGIFKGNPIDSLTEQVGFARVISDLSTFAYLADVFILPPYRGKGLSKWLLQTIMDHSDLANIHRFMLATQDAHTLYTKFGFNAIEAPNKWMERIRSS